MTKIDIEDKRKIISDFMLDDKIILGDSFELASPEGIILGTPVGARDEFSFCFKDGMILNERTKERFKRSTFFEKIFRTDQKSGGTFYFTEAWLEEVKAKAVERKKYTENCLKMIVKEIMEENIFQRMGVLYVNNPYVFSIYKSIVNLSTKGTTNTCICGIKFDEKRMFDFFQSHCFLSSEVGHKKVNITIKNNYIKTKIYKMRKTITTTYDDIIFV